jgi:hypothetical protein
MVRKNAILATLASKRKKNILIFYSSLNNSLESNSKRPIEKLSEDGF